MLHTVRAVIHDGKIEVAEPVDLPEGTPVLVTLHTDTHLATDSQFWSAASQASLGAIWDNAGDDAYAELLKK
jgi:hypothetical protein